jgi:hypothetical protein
MHKSALAADFSVDNFLRADDAFESTLAVAAGVEFEAVALEQAVETTAAYVREKRMLGLRRLLQSWNTNLNLCLL